VIKGTDGRGSGYSLVTKCCHNDSLSLQASYVYIVIPHIPPKPADNEKYTSIIRQGPCTAELSSSERTYWYHTGTHMIKE